MSGDAGGLIIGGLILFGAVPVVLTGLAVAGTVFAGYTLAKAIGKGTSAAAKARHDKDIQVKACSKELDKLYADMRKALDDQAVLHDDYRAALAKKLDKAASDLEELSKQSDMADWHKALAASRKQTQDVMKTSTSAHAKQSAAKAQTELKEALATLQSTHNAKAELIKWASDDAADRAMQKAFALEVLQDAKASVAMLKGLTGSGSFSTQRDAIERSLTAAQTAFDMGKYAAALSSSQTIITQSATLALRNAQEIMALDEARLYVRGRLEGIAEQLQKSRMVTIMYQDEEEVTNDLNDFCQGHYERLQQDVQAMLARVDTATEPDLELLEDEIEAVLEPRIDRITRVAHNRFLSFYERMTAMEKLIDFMIQQNYEPQDLVSVGGDMSQQMAMKFVHSINKDEIVLTLDNTHPTDVSQMELGIQSFDGELNRGMTEPERQAFRARLMKVLQGEGYDGQLHCKGNIGGSSSQKNLQDPDRVLQLPPKPLL